MRNRITLIGAALVSMVSWERVAGADPVVAPPADRAPHQQSRLFAGFEAGFLVTRPLRVDGKRASDEGGNLYVGFHAGYSHALSDRFGVMGLTRYSAWTTAWAERAGEERNRIDLSLGPEVHARDGIVGAYCSLPLGPTIVQSQAAEGRAVQHSYRGGLGVNAGLLCGVDIAGRHSGGYVELAWITHVTWLDHTARLIRSGAVVNESYQYVDNVLLFSAGYLYRL